MGLELLALAIALAILGLHPFITYPVSLLLVERMVGVQSFHCAEASPTVRVALCVSAYNEARIMRAKIENMLRLRLAMPNLELLLYVDAATDGTAEIAQQYADHIRVIVGSARKGKTHGMNLLIEKTDAEFVVFSDANVLFAFDAIPQLLRRFADPEVGCVCGHLAYVSGEATSAAVVGSVYWQLEEAIKELETRTGSTMGADGSIFAIRRALHPAPPADVIDDMYVSLSILCDGHRIVRAANALAYETTVSNTGEEFRRKVRIACQAFNVHRLLRRRLRRLAPLDRYKYFSHKLLRWFSGYLLAGAGLALLAWFACIEAWLVLGASVMTGALLALAGVVWPSSRIGRLLDVVGALAATSLGIVKSMHGERFQTWNPPASARPPATLSAADD